MSDSRPPSSGRQSIDGTDTVETVGTGAPFELAFPSTVYDEFIANNPVSISPRDKLSFVDDKKQWKDNKRYIQNNTNLNRLTRMLQTEIIRCKPDNILEFINDEFFSLENQTRLRNIFRD